MVRARRHPMTRSLWFVALFAAGCGDDLKLTPDAAVPAPDAPASATCQPAALRTDLAWFGNNRAAAPRRVGGGPDHPRRPRRGRAAGGGGRRPGSGGEPARAPPPLGGDPR